MLKKTKKKKRRLGKMVKLESVGAVHTHTHTHNVLIKMIGREYVHY